MQREKNKRIIDRTSKKAVGKRSTAEIIDRTASRDTATDLNADEHPWAAMNSVPSASMPTHIEDLASSYFMVSFSLSSAFHYIPKYWDALVQNGNPLNLSMQALSLAALSLDCRQPLMLIAARSCYSKALGLTNRALSSLKDTSQDSTLLSVLFLSAFEGVLFGEQRPIGRHIFRVSPLFSHSGAKNNCTVRLEDISLYTRVRIFAPAVLSVRHWYLSL
jgi:hypothetical protein